MLYKRIKSIQEWLFPGICLLCSARIRSNADFCAQCDASLPRLIGGCLQCAAPMGLIKEGIHRCGQCQKRPPGFARTLAMFSYGPPIDRLIQDLKYHRRLETARLLGQRFAIFLDARVETAVDVIVPVPLHPTRLRERGYNQSLELARPVAKSLGIRLDYKSVWRTRATPPQTSLPHKARQRNVRGAFGASDALAGLRVAILDDVMTTGHTANTLATCLRRAGAENVDVWVVARA